MREGVIADHVSGLDDFADDVGALLDVASNHEKGCVYVVLREDFEQAQRVRIVGAVVVSQRDLPGATGRGR